MGFGLTVSDMQYSSCYAIHQKDADKVLQTVPIKFEIFANLETQQRTKVPIVCHENINFIFQESETHTVSGQIGSSNYKSFA